jgi:hypothetical protein
VLRPGLYRRPPPPPSCAAGYNLQYDKKCETKYIRIHIPTILTSLAKFLCKELASKPLQHVGTHVTKCGISCVLDSILTPPCFQGLLASLRPAPPANGRALCEGRQEFPVLLNRIRAGVMAEVRTPKMMGKGPLPLVPISLSLSLIKLSKLRKSFQQFNDNGV